VVIEELSVQEMPRLVDPAGAPAGTGKPLEEPPATYEVPEEIPSETRLWMAVVFELLIQTIVHSRSGRPASSKVFRPNGGSNRSGVPVGEGVDVGVAVETGVSVAVAVGVSVGGWVGVPVAVEVGISVAVAVDVDVGVAVSVGVSVGVFVGVSVAALVAVEVGVSVGVFVGLSVAVLVTVGVAVSVGVSVAVAVEVGDGVSVGVSVGVFVGVLVEVLVGVDVGLRTVTVSVLELFVSFPSATWLSGSTSAVLDKLPACEGVTAKLMLNEAPDENVTALLAAQIKSVAVMEQSIVPPGGVLPFVIVRGPCE
jgi:hypothetical protein